MKFQAGMTLCSYIHVKDQIEEGDEVQAWPSRSRGSPTLLSTRPTPPNARPMLASSRPKPPSAKPTPPK